MARLRQLGLLQPAMAKATLCTTPRSRVIAHSRPPPTTSAPGRAPPSQSPNFRRRRREMTQTPVPRVGPRAKRSSDSSVCRMSVRTRGLGGNLRVGPAGRIGGMDYRGGPRSGLGAGPEWWAPEALRAGHRVPSPRPQASPPSSGAFLGSGVHSGPARHADGLVYSPTVVLAGKTLGSTREKRGGCGRERGKGVDPHPAASPWRSQAVGGHVSAPPPRRCN